MRGQSEAQALRATRELTASAPAPQLEVLGRLAASVAHEINTPTQYISDAGHFLRDAAIELLSLLDAYAAAVDLLRSGGDAAAALHTLDRTRAMVDGEFLRQEVPAAAASILEGTTRIAEIVRAMKELSHPGTDAAVPVDVNHVVTSALRMTRSEFKHVAELTLELAEVPRLLGRPADLGNVVVNLVMNARDAIADRPDLAERGTGHIRVATRRVDDVVRVEIEDDGIGIPDELRQRVFDPFFTTKPWGHGTGQGLALVRRVVEQQFGGRVGLRSVSGEGTTFTLDLPIPTPPEVAP